MEHMINFENILSSIIAGYILFLITKNHSKPSKIKSGIEFKLKFKNLEFKFKSNKRN